MKIKTPKYDTLCVFIFFKTSELGVTEHVEGDPCKFALWVGRTPTSDNKIVLKVSMPVSFSVTLFHSVNVKHYASRCTGSQSESRLQRKCKESNTKSLYTSRGGTS